MCLATLLERQQVHVLNKQEWSGATSDMLLLHAKAVCQLAMWIPEEYLGKLKSVIFHIIFKFSAFACNVFKFLPYMRLPAPGSCLLSLLLLQLLLSLNCHSLLADGSLS
jgi:hypothetical protein